MSDFNTFEFVVDERAEGKRKRVYIFSSLL